MPTIKRILLVEDDPKDIELTLKQIGVFWALINQSPQDNATAQ
jgi:hypothetical protein